MNYKRDPKNYAKKPNVHTISPHFSGSLKYDNSSRGKNVTLSITLKIVKWDRPWLFHTCMIFFLVPAKNFMKGK